MVFQKRGSSLSLVKEIFLLPSEIPISLPIPTKDGRASSHSSSSLPQTLPLAPPSLPLPSPSSVTSFIDGAKGDERGQATPLTHLKVSLVQIKLSVAHPKKMWHWLPKQLQFTTVIEHMEDDILKGKRDLGECAFKLVRLVKQRACVSSKIDKYEWGIFWLELIYLLHILYNRVAM